MAQTHFSRRQWLQTTASASLAAMSSQQSRFANAADSLGADRPLLKSVHEDIVCKWSPGHPRHDHQLIFPLDEERLLLVWCEYYANRPSLLERTPTSKANQASDEMPCRISAKVSADRGRTWGDSMTLQENHWQHNVKHPNLVRLSDAEILFGYVGWDSNSQRNVFLKRSTDNGETWSEQVQVSEPGWYCNNADRAMRLSTGRVLIPAHGPFEKEYVGGTTYRGGDLHSFVFYSDDGFRTWKRSSDSMTAPGRGCHEPTIVELNDGRLMCFLRNTNECLYRSYSDDGGEHWSTPQPTELPAPESPSCVKRIPGTGDLLLVWNNVASKSNWPRTPLTAALSHDEGETWKHYQDIDNRSNFDAAYPSVTFVGDEVLIAYYTRSTKWARDSEVTLKTFPLDAFYS
ncbi:MAG: exo-alpha-sialidase [Planctomycetaceae bacterium]|nr:exo-alpha-sialidase [Planctomycetaceae bacterium]